MSVEQLEQYIANKHMSLIDAMQRIDRNYGITLFVTDSSGALCGAVSDGDIRRWILKTGKLDACISELMNTKPCFLMTGEENKAYSLMLEKKYTAIPILDRQGHILNIISLRDEHMISPKTKEQLKDIYVIIMAGGKGTRLYPYTKILPKPLIPIGDVPIIEHIMDAFADFGLKDFYISINYKKNMIRSYFADIDTDYNIEYIEEEKPLGTAGSIKLIDKSFETPIFVTNCDILIRANYAGIYKHHVKSGNAITIVTALKNNVIPYGVIHSGENGEIISMEEKPQISYMVNTGMYIINPEIVKLIPKDCFFHMTHLTDAAIKKGYKVGMYPVSEDSFLDMGEFAEMKRMEEKLNVEGGKP